MINSVRARICWPAISLIESRGVPSRLAFAGRCRRHFSALFYLLIQEATKRWSLAGTVNALCSVDGTIETWLSL